ncbi:hypothetical protein ACWG0P_12140 [Amedibacillus sp. YH-ame6]
MENNLQDLNMGISDLEKTLMLAVKTVSEAVGQMNESLNSLNVDKSFESISTKVAGSISTINSSMTLYKNVMVMMNDSTNSVISAIGGMSGPIGIATVAITGIIGVISLLSNYQSEETKKHNETMEAMNKEIESRNSLKAKQQEQLDANLSEITNLQSLNTELGNLTDANGKVKAGYEDRAAFIVSTLNKALGEQITIEDSVVKGYNKSSDSIDGKIDKMKAEAILEAQLPAYKIALIESTEAQMKADKLQMELSDLRMQKKAKEAEFEAMRNDKSNKYSQEDYQRISKEMSELYTSTTKKEEAYNTQSEIAKGYYEDMANYETNAALLASGNAENYAKVQMDGVSAKNASVEGKKEILASEIEAETEHLALLQKMKFDESDVERQNQLQAQMDAAQMKIDSNQAELDTLSEHQKQVTELKQLNNLEDMNFLGTCIADKQATLTEMYAKEEADWTEAEKKKAEGLKNQIASELSTYSQYATDKVNTAVSLSSKLNENSTAEEKAAAESAMREATSTLQILGQNALKKLDILNDLNKRRKEGDESVTDSMIAEAERQASEAESGYGRVAQEVRNSWKDLPEDSRKTFKNVMDPMMEEMQNKEPYLFSKAGGIAEGILGRLRKSFDIKSPSRKVREIFNYVMEGAVVGLDDKTPELMDQSEEIATDITDVFSRIGKADFSNMAKQLRMAIDSQQLQMRGVVQSNLSQEVYTSGRLKVEIGEIKGILQGKIENRILMDGRETAVQLTPFISEELAFSAR